ncbi:hypothetical protein L6452_17475 [Arctium lappa]|uniref:Uncharacterized protein n=1 Tax=Arctium lappa TaxID=4217 RepID=A0ACB9C3I7_ARCLA|nr:hypothetical protein L6452_17475 [Arctium lappa]
MGRFKIVLFCFFIAGILIFRPIAARPIHESLRFEKVDSKGLSAFAPESLSPAESPVGSDGDESEGGVHSEKHHHSSVAGGGVIIGGLATVTFAAVYCYIRVTRTRDGQNR